MRGLGFAAAMKTLAALLGISCLAACVFGSQRSFAAHARSPARQGYSVAAVKAAFARHGIRLKPLPLRGRPPGGMGFADLIGRRSHRMILVDVWLGPLDAGFSRFSTESTSVSIYTRYRNVLVWSRRRDGAAVAAALHALR